MRQVLVPTLHCPTRENVEDDEHDNQWTRYPARDKLSGHESRKEPLDQCSGRVHSRVSIDVRVSRLNICPRL
jgi:hypothetical protein